MAAVSPNFQLEVQRRPRRLRRGHRLHVRQRPALLAHQSPLRLRQHAVELQPRAAELHARLNSARHSGPLALFEKKSAKLVHVPLDDFALINRRRRTAVHLEELVCW